MSLITYVTRIHFADRVLEDALPEELSKLGVRRPIIVTDAAGEREDLYDRVTDALPPGCDGIALRGVATPLQSADLTRALQVFATSARDGVVGLGGKAALDLARLIAQVSTDTRARGSAHDVWPVIAIPTTTASVGLAHPARPRGDGRVKGGCVRVPSVVLCDPTLTLGADPVMTAAAGMDALTHCIEAYLGTTWNPPADGIALEGVRRAGMWLETAVRDGNDLDARREVLAAALNAGLAAQKGLGGVHALSHALEDEAGLSLCHGWLHAALLPPVLRFNAPAVGERFAALRDALRLPPDADLPGAIAALGARLSMPQGLASLGLMPEALARIARRAAQDPANQTNPRLATASDYLALLQQAH